MVCDVPRARGRKRGESRRGRFDFCCNPSLCFREDALQVKKLQSIRKGALGFLCTTCQLRLEMEEKRGFVSFRLHGVHAYTTYRCSRALRERLV